MRFLWHIAEPPFERHRVSLDRLALEKNFAGGGFDQPGDHFDGGGFTGAIRPEISCYPPYGRGKADIIDRYDAPEPLRHTAEFEHFVHLCSMLPLLLLVK